MSNPQWPPPPNSPYGSPPGGQYPYSPPPSSDGTLILVLGILSIPLSFLLCLGVVLGPIAWVLGNNSLRRLDQYGDPLNQRGMVSSGRICGIIGTVISSLILLFYVGAIILGAIGAATSPSNGGPSSGAPTVHVSPPQIANPPSTSGNF